MSKTLQDVADAKYKKDLEVLETETIGICDAILETIPKATLPETIFINDFLHFFMNPTAYKDTPLLVNWLSIAGSHYSEVDLIDTSGNVVATVPSVYRQGVVDPEANGFYNFYNIVSTYNNRKKITSAQGTNYRYRYSY